MTHDAHVYLHYASSFRGVSSCRIMFLPMRRSVPCCIDRNECPREVCTFKNVFVLADYQIRQSSATSPILKIRQHIFLAKILHSQQASQEDETYPKFLGPRNIQSDDLVYRYEQDVKICKHIEIGSSGD